MDKGLDRHDIAILSALSRDPRAPASELADTVHLSRTAVSRRLIALKECGVFQELPEIISYAALGLSIRSFIEVHPGSMSLERVQETLLGRPEVLRVLIVSGKPSFLVEVVVDDLERLDALIKWMQQFGNTETTIVFSEHRSCLSLKQRLDALGR